MAIFVYGMIGYTLLESLENRYNAWTKNVKFVGFVNYTQLWQDQEFTHALSNLLKFTAVFMIGCLISGLIMSLLLEKGIKGEGSSVLHISTQWRFHLSRWEHHGAG